MAKVTMMGICSICLAKVKFSKMKKIKLGIHGTTQVCQKCGKNHPEDLRSIDGIKLVVMEKSPTNGYLSRNTMKEKIGGQK